MDHRERNTDRQRLSPANTTFWLVRTHSVQGIFTGKFNFITQATQVPRPCFLFVIFEFLLSIFLQLEQVVCRMNILWNIDKMSHNQKQNRRKHFNELNTCHIHMPQAVTYGLSSCHFNNVTLTFYLLTFGYFVCYLTLKLRLVILVWEIKSSLQGLKHNLLDAFF